jgi:hypothetical protein
MRGPALKELRLQQQEEQGGQQGWVGVRDVLACSSGWELLQCKADMKVASLLLRSRESGSVSIPFEAYDVLHAYSELMQGGVCCF